jgi:hypothetical protein
MICYQMNKSNELRFTDLASPNFISLLRDYEVLGSIFNLSGVGFVLHELKIRSDTLDMVNQLMRTEAINLADIFISILQVDSFEFKLLQAQAILHVAQTEKDPVKLQNILTGFSMRLQQLEQFGVKLYSNQKKEYLFKLVPLLSDILDMLELEQKFLETTIRGNPQQKDLSQKLEESLSGANPMH